jgi:thiol:disulfide interchange protein DsbC
MSLRHILVAAGISAALLSNAKADEVAIRKNLTSRLPNLPKIDSVRPSEVKGLWEIRIGSELIYSDELGSYVIEGQIIDTKSRTNVTERRIEELTAFDFRKLPLHDAVTWKKGTGARRIVVFADPNCGYCKQLERDLSSVPDITVYTFLVPVLGGDSPELSRAIWCARDNGKVWRSWMLNGTAPPKAASKCNSAVLERNLALSRKHGLVGTPLLVFEDNQRVPGIMTAADLTRKLAAVVRGRNKG